MTMPTQSMIKSLFLYSDESGHLIWRRRSRDQFTSDHNWRVWNTRFAGKVAGTVHRRNGYRDIRIGNKQYKAHRLVWCLHNGDYPAADIDHINHNRDDNRIDNLRAVNREANGRNQKLHRTNSSGFAGVIWNKKLSKWEARIDVAGKRIYLGIFPDLEKAVDARKRAQKRFGFHPNHGAPHPGDTPVNGTSNPHQHPIMAG